MTNKCQLKQFAPVLLLFLCAHGQMRAGDAKFVKKTFVYKQVGDLKIEADVYRAGDAVKRPVVVWIHGGALLMNSRRNVSKRILDLWRTEGYVLVSFDYRLAPQVKLPQIVKDVKDAIKWVRLRGPKLFHANPDRLVVSGGSAGAYLTIMMGIAVQPRPTALVAYSGYGDVDGAWYSQPSEHYRKRYRLLSEKDARRRIGKKVLTGAPWRQGGKDRNRFYIYLRQNGLWTKEITGFDPKRQRDKLNAYCPLRNITPKYPPILMVHGTADTDVPYARAAAMAKELAKHGVTHELISLKNAERELRGGDRQKLADAHKRALGFIKRYLKK